MRRCFSTIKRYLDKDGMEEITSRARPQVAREIRVKGTKCSLEGEKSDGRDLVEMTREGVLAVQRDGVPNSDIEPVQRR